MMKKIIYKRGNTFATYPLVLFISIFLVITIGIFCVNSVIPFIWYQKLNFITQKYMFVIEKFGYLTNLEKANLINELNVQGFDVNNIKITAPSNKRSYGELIEFKITYVHNYKNISGFKLKDNSINMVVKKSSYSKI